jgi:hypothetical protein
VCDCVGMRVCMRVFVNKSSHVLSAYANWPTITNDYARRGMSECKLYL